MRCASMFMCVRERSREEALLLKCLNRDSRQQPAARKITRRNMTRRLYLTEFITLTHVQLWTVYETTDIAKLGAWPFCPHHTAFDPPSHHNRPAFSDGVISVAVDEAINLGSLYFTSGGNNGFGYRFTSVSVGLWSCT